MNNPKLTNVLLIALIALNSIFLLGWVASRHHHRREMSMRENFRMHRFQGRNWAFHRHQNYCCYGGCGSFHNYRHHRNFGEMRNGSM